MKTEIPELTEQVIALVERAHQTGVEYLYMGIKKEPPLPWIEPRLIYRAAIAENRKHFLGIKEFPAGFQWRENKFDEWQSIFDSKHFGQEFDKAWAFLVRAQILQEREWSENKQKYHYELGGDCMSLSRRPDGLETVRHLEYSLVLDWREKLAALTGKTAGPQSQKNGDLKMTKAFLKQDALDYCKEKHGDSYGKIAFEAWKKDCKKRFPGTPDALFPSFDVFQKYHTR